MYSLDDIDRKLLAHLKIDGRASITTLAGSLKLARGTVQTRLNHLIAHQIIRRFTVETNAPDIEETVRAIMMIEVRGNTAAQVQKALGRMAEVTSLHRTCGVWDLVIELETTNLVTLDDILSRIRELPGVSNSETCPLLRRVT